MSYNTNIASDEILEEEPLTTEAEKVTMEDGSPPSELPEDNKKPKEKETADLQLSFGEASLPPEQRISAALVFMEKALAQPGSPHFKEFWEARKLCLDYFKEPISPPVRTYLWGKYCEFSKEARRLKEILDEQTAFAVEQIEIAVKALEDEIINEEEVLSRALPIHFNPVPQFLQNKLDLYVNIQLRLGLYNAHASRINVLRKELIKTDMRIRQKNRFFQRLSLAGDKVFPIRKELIRESSTQFIDDVDAFIAANFPSDTPKGDLYHLREEIKALQSIAKQLSLNTHAFTHTRKRLSDCWDKLKELEKERKKERSQQKAVYKQHQDEIEAEIKSVLEQFNSDQITLDEARKYCEQLNNKMRKTELGRDEVKYLRDALAQLREPIEAKEKTIQQAQAQEEQQRQAQRLEKVHQLRQKLQDAISNETNQTVDELSALSKQLVEEGDNLHLTRNERIQLERFYRELKDKISFAKDQAILSLAEEGKGGANYAALKADLAIITEHRRQIKETLDQLKRLAGLSGLDISKAMELNHQIMLEKERYDKAMLAASDLEKKLRSYKAK